METNKYDLVIIGGGPAGLTAALYAGRANLSVLVIEQGEKGSLLMAHKIDNYPGFPAGITGKELYMEMKKHAERFGAKFIEAKLLDIDISQKPRIIKTDKVNIAGDSVIIATGVAKSNQKKFPGEEEYLGKGVSYCATCDGAFFRNMTVSLVGNGDEVAEEALFLTRFAKSIFVFSKEDFECSKDLKEQIEANEKIKVLSGFELKEIKGEEFVEKVIVAKNGFEEEYETAAVFMYLGTKNNVELFSIFADVDENGYIITGEDMKTLEAGIFAAGDVRKKGVRQVTTATADGTIAALEAIKYINNLKK